MIFDIILVVIFIVLIVINIHRGAARSLAGILATVLSYIGATALGKMLAAATYSGLVRPALDKAVSDAVSNVSADAAGSVLESLPKWLTGLPSTNSIWVFSTMFSTDLVGELMEFLGIYGISDRMNTFITAVADNVFGIVWSSGIQILLFLAGLQNISKDVREAAQMEGATAWEYFWKIVFPSVSPFILANLIFTVIDSFTNPMNSVMNRIVAMKNQWEFGGASAMAWVYFAIVLGAIGVFAWLTGKFIQYETD